MLDEDGRVVGVNSIFTTGGPQLGQFESGLVADLWTAEISALSGGIATLLLAACGAAATPAAPTETPTTPAVNVSVPLVAQKRCSSFTSPANRLRSQWVTPGMARGMLPKAASAALSSAAYCHSRHPLPPHA